MNPFSLSFGNELVKLPLLSAQHENDFSEGIIASVNHDGDSDSTGAVTGNILGALIGYDGIDSKWKDQLQFKNLLLHYSDLCMEAALN